MFILYQNIHLELYVPPKLQGKIIFLERSRNPMFNFQLLLTMYFFAAIFHSFLFTASYLMMIERFLDYQTDCDIHVSMVPYAIVHSSIACCLFCGMLTQVRLLKY